MAKGQFTTVTAVKLNNAKALTTVSKVVELIVVNGQLVPDNREIDAGVNSINQ